MAMIELPTGTVTFLFTDVEGSTRLLRALGAERYSEALAGHNALLRAEFEREGGIETHHQGDSFVVVFRSAGAAVRAAVAAQQALARHDWPESASVRVRMGLHTGEATIGHDGYVGFAVHQASRIGDAGHGGQVLVSTTTAALVEPELPDGVGLRDLGSARLPDLDRPERLFQLVIPGLNDRFPPLAKRVSETSPAPGPPLLEREAELAVLEAIVDTVEHGNGRVVAIEAGAGLGKTRLLAEARRIASGAGLEVLTARGGELEREFPYGVVRQLFEPAVAAADQEDLLAGAASLAAPLFEQDSLTENSDQAADTSFATLHGLYWLTANLASRRPVVLAIDDAHWSDQPSLRWLAYLGRRLEGVPVLLIVGLRPPAPSADERLLGELVTDSATTVLRPGALTEDAVQTLIRTMLSAEGDPTFVSACATATSGNPFLLRELLTTLAAEGVRPQRESVALVEELGPQAASRAVSMRLSRLPSEALQLAQAVAVLGDDVDLGHAATLAGLDRDLAAHMAGALARTDILRPEHSLSFVHHVVRAAVYQELDPGEAEDAHARAASILAEAGAPAEQVAAQVLHARPSGDAGRVKVLRAAARIARGRGAPESAVAYLRRALEEPPPDELRAGVLYELGSVEKLVHGPSAAEHLREALARTTDPVQRVQTRIELARALFFSQQIEPAAEAFAAAIAELPPEDAEPRRRALAGYLFASLSDAAMLATAAPYFQEAARLDLSTSVGGSMLRAVLAFHHGRYGRATRAETIAECRLALEGDALFQEEDAAFYSLPGLLLDMADCLDESEVVWERVLAVAEQRGSIFAFAAGMGFRARTRYLRGALSDAAEDARAALEAATAHGLVTGLPYALAFLGDALVDLGRLDEAEATLAQLGLGEDVPLSTHLGFFLNARGRLRIQQARHEDGIRDLETVGRIEASCGVQNPGYTSWRPDAALGYLQLGDTERARVLVDDEVERARAWGAPRALGDGLRAAGLVAGGDEGIAMLREAVDVLGRSPSRLRHARALVDLGGALRRANHRSDAREHLRRGRELAEISGARPLTELAGAELAATGARLRTVVLSGVDALTASERRVAEMARDGLTNRQIAQSLFVTPKTVEVHLSSVYRKLGIASRNQLADALGGRPAQVTAT